MSNVLVQGLQGRIKELEERLRSNKALESKCRNLEEENKSLKRTAMSDTDPFACTVCLQRTPDVLPCFHRCCSDCMQTLMLNESRNHRSPTSKCPACFTPFVIDVRGVELITIEHRRTEYQDTVAMKSHQVDLMSSYIMRLSEWAAQNYKEKGGYIPVRRFTPHSAPTSPRDRSSTVL